MKHFSAADACQKKRVLASRKDHILPTILYQSLYHWGPETSSSRSQKYVQLIIKSSEDHPCRLKGRFRVTEII